MEIITNNEFDIKEFICEKKLSINISVENIIYFPGEEIKGSVYIQGKGTLANPLFIYSLVKVSISQIYYYEYDVETKIESDLGEEKFKLKIPFVDKVKEKETQIIYSTMFNYSQYLGTNLIDGLKLPFQIILPNNIEPTFYFKNSYIRHILTFDFYEYESKTSIGFIIKNPRFFSLENKSLKEPLTVFKDMTKSKFIFFSQGKIAVYITSKSNSYKYGDKIPLEITIDSSELNINLIGIQIKFDRYIQFNNKNDKNSIKEFFTHNLFCKEVKFEEKKNNYKYNIIISPKNDDYCFEPDIFYSIIEANYLKLNLPEIDLFPFCSGGLINCLYLINVKLYFDSLATTDETISIPIELYFDNNKNDINKNEIILNNPYNEIFKEDDINENLNINSINNNRIKEKDGFEVIEQEDFIKALNTNNSKP
jgi:hypothetical protein